MGMRSTVGLNAQRYPREAFALSRFAFSSAFSVSWSKRSSRFAVFVRFRAFVVQTFFALRVFVRFRAFVVQTFFALRGLRPLSRLRGPNAAVTLSLIHI